jgi:hypothetical protein
MLTICPAAHLSPLPVQTDLDDDCLLTIFQFLAPLPDVISVSKACRVGSLMRSYLATCR